VSFEGFRVEASLKSSPPCTAVSSVRIGCRAHQVTHTAGLRHADRVGHQPGRAYARKINPQFQRKCFCTNPSFCPFGTAWPVASPRAGAHDPRTRTPVNSQESLASSVGDGAGRYRAAITSSSFSIYEGESLNIALLTTSCVHHHVNNREVSAAYNLASSTGPRCLTPATIAVMGAA
jgi:hypothetical protein